MTVCIPQDTPLSEAQREALEVFEAWSDDVEAALATGEPDVLLDAIASRAVAIHELETAFLGQALPPALQPRFMEREARVAEGLRRLSDSILAQLAEARQHVKARARYAQTEGTGASEDEETR